MRRTIWIAFLLWGCSITYCDASWGSPGTGQYHIQTDEGPERYFKFQTDNGQYRKEKRLQDGTVIGTDAWIDAAGYLRQKDYIADSKGYRILKSKTIYVGQGRPIEEAIRSVKGVAAQSGVLVDPGLSYGSNHFTPTHRPTPRPPTTTTTTTTTTTPAPPTQGYLSPSEAALIPPSPYLGYDHYPQPEVFIRPHSQPVESNIVPETYYLLGSSSTEKVPPPSDTFLPPYESSRRVRPIGASSTTPAPDSDNEAIEYSHSSTENYPSGYSYSSPRPFSSSTTEYPEQAPSSSQAPISSNDYDDPYGYNSYSSSTTERPPLEYSTPYADLLPPTKRRRPAYGTRIQTQIYSNNNLGNGYENQYSQYDGVSVTKHGFRYFLPRQYHEEEQVGSQKRAGSFGYIDPFGIRRVIYYNASPQNGFVHRKNNRYVGFQATPYDPRPL